MCPGGGYRINSQREAEPVALQLLAKDICVFLLRYAVAFPLRLLEANHI